MKYLLDTNVLSEFKAPKPDPQVRSWLQMVDEDDTYLSVISLGELREGVARLGSGRRRTELEGWLRDELPARFAGRVLDVTSAIADLWGVLNADAKRRGINVSVTDAYIAATTRVHELTLVTRNTRDFHSLNVKLLNPWLTR